MMMTNALMTVNKMLQALSTIIFDVTVFRLLSLLGVDDKNFEPGS